MKIIKICNKVIEYSFYVLFLLVPLVFTSSTFELFEFNKMWLAFGLTLIIAGAWFTKAIAQKELKIQRTPLDIPIALFLLFQIVSTIFSWDRHVSLWGYYSRFNGGLLSISAYVFLYYAFLSNFFQARGETNPQRVTRAGGHHAGAPALLGEWETRGAGERQDPQGRGNSEAIIMVKRLLMIGLASGFVVALWGLPSHFGFDPTCLIFRGNLDVSCWTEAFKPQVRIFSTLGQPDWLAAYLAILIPIAIAFSVIRSPSSVFSLRFFGKSVLLSDRLKTDKHSPDNRQPKTDNKTLLFSIFYLLLSILFYLDLIFTDSRSGFLAVWLALIFFVTAYLYLSLAKSDLAKLKVEFTKSFLKKFSLKYWYLLVVIAFFALITFFVGTPFHQFDKLTFPGIKSERSKITQPKETKSKTAQDQTPAKAEGGTESGQIRAIVWKGAIDAWLHNPVFGTGVETFAFAYYRYRPVEHNLVSEWDFLYNKAHNEYLNYLATTGIFGLGTYLLMIGWFFAGVIPNLVRDLKKNKMLKPSQTWKQVQHDKVLILALIAGYLSILVTNFFGFSVVIVNLYLFLIPAFVFVLGGMIDPQKALFFPKQKGSFEQKLSTLHWVLIVALLFTIFYLLFTLSKFWQADRAYALGYNLDRVGQYQQAYPKLHEAVTLRNDEPVFQDELAINDAILAAALNTQKEATTAAFLANEAVKISDELTSKHPKNVVFAKTRVRVFYALSQYDQKYLFQALEAILAAQKLAPTDAKISYNLGLLYGQNGDTQKAVETLENTIKLKPDYRDAYYALGLFYRELAVDKGGKVKDSALQKKAVEIMRYLMKVSQGQDEPAKTTLKGWGEL